MDYIKIIIEKIDYICIELIDILADVIWTIKIFIRNTERVPAPLPFFETNIIYQDIPFIRHFFLFFNLRRLGFTGVFSIFTRGCLIDINNKLFVFIKLQNDIHLNFSHKIMSVPNTFNQLKIDLVTTKLLL